MIALDTNVLVRLVLRDDEAQAQRARELVENGCEAIATFDGGMRALPQVRLL